MVVSGTTNAIHFERCRIENTNAAAASRAINFVAGANYCIVQDCYIKATTSATSVFLSSINTILEDSWIVGGAIGFTPDTSNSVVHNCVFSGYATTGIENSLAASVFVVRNCSFKGGTNGIKLTTVPNMGAITDCYFDGCTNGVNNSSGANTAHTSIKRLGQFGVTTLLTGFGDVPHFNAITAESATAYTNSGSNDFSIISGSNLKGAGSPGLYEGSTFTSYLDVGAVQRQEPTSTGGSRGIIGG